MCQHDTPQVVLWIWAARPEYRESLGIAVLEKKLSTGCPMTQCPAQNVLSRKLASHKMRCFKPHTMIRQSAKSLLRMDETVEKC